MYWPCCLCTNKSADEHPGSAARSRIYQWERVCRPHRGHYVAYITGSMPPPVAARATTPSSLGHAHAPRCASGSPGLLLVTRPHESFPRDAAAYPPRTRRALNVRGPMSARRFVTRAALSPWAQVSYLILLSAAFRIGPARRRGMARTLGADPDAGLGGYTLILGAYPPAVRAALRGRRRRRDAVSRTNSGAVQAAASHTGSDIACAPGHLPLHGPLLERSAPKFSGHGARASR